MVLKKKLNSQALPVRVAIMDLYNNEPNQGMRCLKEIVSNMDKAVHGIPVTFSVFETRYRGEIPSPEYDIYISSGGPGSPFDGEGKPWEEKYFGLIEQLWNRNQKNSTGKKYVFFICHSFQLMARHFQLAVVRKRNRRSFGIVPVYKTPCGETDPLFSRLPKKFFAADFRQYEVIEPDLNRLHELGGRVLSIENERKDPAMERAVMTIRLSEEMIGTQFHPEADPESMLYHFQQPDRKKQVVVEYGEKKYNEMIAQLEDPANILLTRRTVLPGFLRDAILRLRLDESHWNEGQASAHNPTPKKKKDAPTIVC